MQKSLRVGSQLVLTLPPGDSDGRAMSLDKEKETGAETWAERTGHRIPANSGREEAKQKRRRRNRQKNRSQTRAEEQRAFPPLAGETISKRTDEAERPSAGPRRGAEAGGLEEPV